MRTYFLILCLFLCGCRTQSKLDSGSFDDFLQRASHSPKQSGDFAAFFVQQVSRYGGHKPSSDRLPEMNGTWYFESDHDGFAVQLYDVSFTQVASFMQQVYGSPISAAQPHGLYGAGQIGVAIQFNANTHGVGFICLEKQTR